MSEADDAYEAAEAAIAKARRDGATGLDLATDATRALTRLPPGIGDLTGLTSLTLNNTQVADLAPLKNLTGLQALYLNNTQVADLALLQTLTGLQTLYLSDTQVTDLAPLQSLTGLLTLTLDNTQVTDLAPLQSLTGLQTLYLRNTQVTDLTPLQSLTGLQTLWLDNTQVTDLTPLQSLTGLLTLYLDNTQVTDLDPLQSLTGLLTLTLDNTQVTDLDPLQGLTGLQTLTLDNTQVTDLAPLQSITGLLTLTLDNTQVTDLRPIRDLTALIEGAKDRNRYRPGLHFTGTPAARATPELTRLSEIEDDAERTKATLAYLHTLPPWPQPLPWAIPDTPLPDTPPDPLDPDAVPRVLVTDGRVDLDHSPATDTDAADPIKARLYAKLPEAAAGLVRFGNRYPEIDTAAKALRDLVSVPFAEADLLDIHLQVAALSDAKQADTDKPAPERLDADCMTALNTVIRLGPPVTLGHPDVDLFEARSVEYARTRRAATVAEGERQFAQGLSDDPGIATERTRTTSGQLAKAGDTGRVANYRSAFTRNTVRALAMIAGALADAAMGHVAGEAVVAAAQFLILHKDAIMATAPAWGETGYRWAEYLMMRADQIVRDARTPPKE